MSLTMQEAQALIDGTALPMDVFWEIIEARTELEYEEFLAMWQKRPERKVIQ